MCKWAQGTLPRPSRVNKPGCRVCDVTKEVKFSHALFTLLLVYQKIFMNYFHRQCLSVLFQINWKRNTILSISFITNLPTYSYKISGTRYSNFPCLTSLIWVPGTANFITICISICYKIYAENCITFPVYLK